MVPDLRKKLNISLLNQTIYETIKNKEGKVDGEEICDKHAKRLWHEVEKQILNLSHEEKFAGYHIANIELYSTGKIIVTYHKKNADELKSYDVPKEVDANRIFIRMALIAEKAGFSMAPSHQMSSKGRILWWIRFVETKDN